MDTALITKWVTPFPGREKRALEYAAEVSDHWGKLAADGKCTEPEFFYFGDSGMWMTKGKRDELLELTYTDESRRLLAKGRFLLQGFTWELAATGSDAEQTMLAYGRVAEEYGTV